MKLPCTHIKNFHIPIRPMANAQSMIMPQGTWRRDYCGNVIYKDGQIERVLTPEGYAVPDGEGWAGGIRRARRRGLEALCLRARRAGQHPRRGRREQCRVSIDNDKTPLKKEQDRMPSEEQFQTSLIVLHSPAIFE